MLAEAPECGFVDQQQPKSAYALGELAAQKRGRYGEEKWRRGMNADRNFIVGLVFVLSLCCDSPAGAHLRLAS